MVNYLLSSLVCILVITLVVCLKFYREWCDRKEKVDCEKMLMNVFLMQINMPELSLIWDTVKTDATQEQKAQYQLKKDPFIIYVLSVFDLVVDYYYGKNSYSIRDSLMKGAWINTITNFFRDSSDMKQIYKEHHSEFNGRFQAFVDSLLNVKGNDEP